MKLLFKTTNGVYLDNTRDQAQLRLDDPVLNGSQVHCREWLFVGLARVWLSLKGVHVDFAEPGRDWPHRHLNALRQLVFDLLYTFVDQLPGKIAVCAILKDNGHLAKTVS